MITFSKIPIKIIYKDSSEEELEIESPNGEDGFKFFIVNTGSSNYIDGNKNLRKGSRFRKIRLVLNYSSHYLPLHKLLVSEFVEFDLSEFDLPFNNNLFRFNADSIKKQWYENLVLSVNGSSFEESNPVPSGGVSLEFESALMFDSNFVEPGSFSVTFSDYDDVHIGGVGNTIEVSNDAVVTITSAEYFMQDRMGTMASNPTFTLKFRIYTNEDPDFSSASKIVNNGCSESDDTLSGELNAPYEFDFSTGVNILSFAAERLTGSVTQACGGSPRNINCVLNGFIDGDAVVGNYDETKVNIVLN